MYISYDEARKMKVTKMNCVDALVHIEIARNIYANAGEDIKELTSLFPKDTWEHIILPKNQLDNIQRVLAKNWVYCNRLRWKTPLLLMSIAVNIYLLITLMGV